MAYTEEDVLRTLPGVRPVLEQVAHKWTILILTFLCEEPKRFNALKRRLDGITQKALTDALRRLERNGLVRRTVTTSSPIAGGIRGHPAGAHAPGAVPGTLRLGRGA